MKVKSYAAPPLVSLAAKEQKAIERINVESRFGDEQEGSAQAQKIEKEQSVEIRARSERRWRRFIAERGRNI